ncbi:hypothetical protein ACWCYL_42345 [Streptomyces sp. 900105755]
MLLRLASLAATNTFVSPLRLPPMSDRDKDIEILALRRQLLVLQPYESSSWGDRRIHTRENCSPDCSEKPLASGRHGGQGNGQSLTDGGG